MPIRPPVRASAGTGWRTPADHSVSSAKAPVTRGRWREMWRRWRPEPPDERTLALARVRRYEDAVEVLERAREVVERGWVQGTWYVVARPGKPPRPAPIPSVAARDDVVGACLVGAVIHAAKQDDPHADMAVWGLPLDLLWDAVNGRAAESGDAAAGTGWRAAPAYVRAARARDIARWNDHPGRDVTEVLRTVDVAVAGAIQGAVTAAPSRAEA